MSRTLRAVLNESNANKSPAADHQVLVGDALAIAPAFITGTVSGNVLLLPQNAKAGQVLRCWARAGGSTGNKQPAAAEATPGAGFCSVNQLGDIEFAAADAVTAVDVLYVPVEGTIVTEQVQVTASVGLFLNSKRVSQLLSVTVDTGIVLGAKVVADRASAPALGSASASAAGTGVTFNAGDVVTGLATLVYIASPGVGTDTQASLASRLQTAVDY